MREAWLEFCIDFENTFKGDEIRIDEINAFIEKHEFLARSTNPNIYLPKKLDDENASHLINMIYSIWFTVYLRCCRSIERKVMDDDNKALKHLCLCVKCSFVPSVISCPVCRLITLKIDNKV